MMGSLDSSLALIFFALPALTQESAGSAPVEDVHVAPELEFVENVGQWRNEARFASRSRRGFFWAVDSGFALAPPSWTGDTRDAVYFRFRGCDSPPVGEVERMGTARWYVARDGRLLDFEARRFARLVWRDVAPGIHLQVAQTVDGWEYDLLVMPGAELESCRFDVLGRGVVSRANGNRLDVHGATATLLQGEPRAFVDDGDGRRRELTCSLVSHPEGAWSIDVPDWDGASRLTIDPPLVWGSFLGGAGGNLVRDLQMAPDSTGFLVGGGTSSLDFPVPLVQHGTPTSGELDAFVAKIALDGSVLDFATFVGGDALDLVGSLDVHDGLVWAAGNTRSSLFPASPGAHLSSPAGDQDGFVLCLDADSGALIASTLVGSPSYDNVTSIRVAPDGNPVVGGGSSDLSYPPTDVNLHPTGTGFLLEFDADLSNVVYATNLGNSVECVDVLSGDRVAVAGTTFDPSFPLTSSSWIGSPGAGFAWGFAAIVDLEGSSLESSTLIRGDSAGETVSVHALATNEDVLLIGGSTTDPRFPTSASAHQSVLAGPSDGFLLSLDMGLSQPNWSTLVGGAASDYSESVWSVDVDGSGVVTFLLRSSSNDLPVTPGSFSDADPSGAVLIKDFVGRLSPSGSLLYGSNVSDGNGVVEALEVAADGSAIVGGPSSSASPTTLGAIQPASSPPLWSEAHLMLLSLMPQGVTAIGTPSVVCDVPSRLDVTRMPVAGDMDFELYASQAPPSAFGYLLVGASSVEPGFDLLGAEVFVSPEQPFSIVFAGVADPDGWLVMDAPLPVSSAGKSLYLQFAWIPHAICAGDPVLATTGALRVIPQ